MNIDFFCFWWAFKIIDKWLKKKMTDEKNDPVSFTCLVFALDLVIATNLHHGFNAEHFPKFYILSASAGWVLASCTPFFGTRLEMIVLGEALLILQ